jgi:DNA-binding beta-propeller fold protein YncE
MKAWLFGAAALPLALYLALHTEPAATRIPSNALLLEESGGTYSNASRLEPSPDARRYWADAMAGTIYRSAFDGTSAEALISDVGIPYGMAFDADAQALLWTNAAAETVQKVELAGGAAITLATAFEEPYAIDISSETELAFFTATGNVVYRNSIDTQTGTESSQEILSLPETETIHGLALDTKNGTLYVGDDNGRMTRKIVLANNSVQALPHTDTEVAPDLGPVDATALIDDR